MSGFVTDEIITETQTNKLSDCKQQNYYCNRGGEGERGVTCSTVYTMYSWYQKSCTEIPFWIYTVYYQKWKLDIRFKYILGL